MRTLRTILTALVLCSCSDPNPPQNSSSSSSAVYIAVHEPGYEVPDTIVTGRFAIVSGCLIFRSSDDGTTYLPILPRGSRLEDRSGGGRILSVNGTALAVLDREVRLHGGPGFYGPAGQARPDQCPAEQIILSGQKG